MTTKEYLSQYIKALRYAEVCLFKYEEALIIGPKSQRFDGMPKAVSKSDLGDTVARITALESKFDRAREKALKLADEIFEIVEAVPDMEERRLLKLRYIDGKPWDEVATEMFMSERATFYLHGMALLSARAVIDSRK